MSAHKPPAAQALSGGSRFDLGSAAYSLPVLPGRLPQSSLAPAAIQPRTISSWSGLNMSPPIGMRRRTAGSRQLEVHQAHLRLARRRRRLPPHGCSSMSCRRPPAYALCLSMPIDRLPLATSNGGCEWHAGSARSSTSETSFEDLAPLGGGRSAAPLPLMPAAPTAGTVAAGCRRRPCCTRRRERRTARPSSASKTSYVVTSPFLTGLRLRT